MKKLWMIALVLAAVGCGSGGGSTGRDSEALSRRPVGDPCRVECHIEFDDCNSACSSDLYPYYCMCLCQNQLALCIGECNGGHPPPLQECLPPTDGL